MWARYQETSKSHITDNFATLEISENKTENLIITGAIIDIGSWGYELQLPFVYIVDILMIWCIAQASFIQKVNIFANCHPNGNKPFMSE